METATVSCTCSPKDHKSEVHQAGVNGFFTGCFFGMGIILLGVCIIMYLERKRQP